MLLNLGLKTECGEWQYKSLKINKLRKYIISNVYIGKKKQKHQQQKTEATKDNSKIFTETKDMHGQNMKNQPS